jgi:hypothetical protein
VKTAAAIAVIAIGLGFAREAAAFDRSSHERIKISAIKKGTEVIGLRMKLTLRPVDESRPVVRIGIGPNDPSKYDYAAFREQASDPKKGYLLHQWPEITIDKKDIGQGKAKEVTLEVLYADAPELAKWDPAKEVEIISAWSDAKASVYWHVWGMQSWNPDKASVRKLPARKTAKAPRKAARRVAALGRTAARRFTTARRAAARTLTARRTALRTRVRSR